MAATAPDIFDDFAQAIDRVLAASDDPEVVIQALNELGAGSKVVIQETEIESLSGLGSEPQTRVSVAYRDAMLKLLMWGIRMFPLNPSVAGLPLWKAMYRLDGRRGYNQGCAQQDIP
jgi:hypothetical protein